MEDSKLIDGYENYVIFSNGNVLNTDTDKWLYGSVNKHGYITINLSKNGKVKKFLFHRLLAEHFIENPENKPCVDHINHNRSDNRLENLRWVTRQENNKNISLSKYNKFGFRGVCFYKKDSSFLSCYYDNDGKQFSKSFSINKYGYIQALKLAVNFRYEMEQTYNYMHLMTPDDYFRSNEFLKIFYEYQ